MAEVHRRQPLGPGDARANVHAYTYTKAASSAASSPNHFAGKKVDRDTPQHTRKPSLESPSNHRVAAIVNDTQRDTKRDSEISNASSTATTSGRKRTVGRWQLGKTVGRGGCSTVRLVRHQDTGQVGAVKIISRKMAEQVRAQSLANLAAQPDRSMADLVAAGKAMPPPPPGLMREIAIMKLLDHPNIVRLHDVWENHNELYLIMEYVQGGELFHYVEECRGLDERETVYIFRQIVAALLYCHRMHIHHRDLKPENILLDRENALVKLVDFGMAALQPEGKQLTTACGSPHYAAPEVIRSKPYDGAKSDVWSCGVILYVMLTGTTPFNYDQERNLAVMYQAIAAADYYMPPELSFEAKDLLRRIFVPKPERRISMDEVWDHPLLHKYDREFGYEGALSRKDAWIGPIPKLEDWSVSKAQDIDKEILRNMRTLWHSVPQDVLIQKLISKELNQEKFFYAALMKHREEHLENYTGGDGVGYSASDYQHSKPGSAAPQTKQTSQSSYSIMNNEHLRSSSIAEPAPGDVPRPNRPQPASRTLNSSRSLHRRGASVSTVNSQRAGKPSAALRVETLKKQTRHSSSRPGTAHSHRKSPSQGSAVRARASRSSLTTHAVSRNSLSSSHWPSSPPVAVPARTVSSHKRNVSFKHVRKTSNVGGHGPKHESPEVAGPQPFSRPAREHDLLPSSPSDRMERRRAPGSTPRNRARNSETPSHYIRTQVRKVSSELEQACEEAFFRTSFGSSEQASLTENRPYETPPSSVSNGTFGKDHRPLPALPLDTPNTFIARTLEETRSKLVARSAAEGSTDVTKFQQVLASLEMMMPPPGAERRITSAPEAKSAGDLGTLPMIKEELPETLRVGKGPNGAGNRSITAPVPARSQTADVKRSAPVEELPRPKTADPSTRHLQVPDARPNLLRKNSHDSAVGLKSVSEEEPQETVSKKKSFWFRRWKDGPEAKNALPTIVGEDAEPEEKVMKTKPSLLKREKQPPQPLDLDKTTAVRPALTSDGSEFPMRRTSEGAVTKAVNKWFGKLPWEKKELMQESEMNEKHLSPDSAFANGFGAPPSPNPNTPVTPSIEPPKSWFSRFLRLRPEPRVLAFKVARGRARAETYRLLRSWSRAGHGIVDLTYYPSDNAITGRVDRVNALGIKPVSFRVELFVVLRDGKKSGLSLARWTQVRGAASSFKRVVSTVESVLRSKGVLVEDEEQWRELEGILA